MEAPTTTAPGGGNKRVPSKSHPYGEHLIQPDEVRGVVDAADDLSEAVTTENRMQLNTSTSEMEMADGLNEGPHTEALVGIRMEELLASERHHEGSGGRRPQDNDDDDYDDDDDDDEEAKKEQAAKRKTVNARENADRNYNQRRFNNYNGDLEDDSDEEDETSRYLKNRRLGKNNAIKFISTPHGKVGIVYQATTEDRPPSSSVAGGGGIPELQKDAFRGISSDLKPILISSTEARSNEERHFLSTGGGGSSGGSVNSKITPVLTADGKVALLYRGASADHESAGSSSNSRRYEPLLTSNFTRPLVPPALDETNNNNNNYNNDNKASSSSSRAGVMGSNRADQEKSPAEQYDNVDDDDSTNRVLGAEEDSNNDNGNNYDNRNWSFEPEQKEEQVGAERVEENNFLPILDRPLSELLGLKKHQFTHFRVTEPPTTPIPRRPSVNMRGKMPPNYDYDLGLDYNDLRFGGAKSDGDNDDRDGVLSKTEVVNLAIIPSLTKSSSSADEARDTMLQHKGTIHYRNHKRIRFDDLSNIHCAMQAMVAVAALACIFGMVGAYLKNRVLDQVTTTYRW